MADEVKTVRLRNINSGAVVEVVEDKADRMGSEWEPAGARKASASKAVAKAAAKPPDNE